MIKWHHYKEKITWLTERVHYHDDDNHSEYEHINI